MKPILLGALPCLLMAQVQPRPIPYAELAARLRPGPEILRTEALLAERARDTNAIRGFLREGPTLSLSAGPRTSPQQATTTDQAVELDLPLFLSPRLRKDLLNSYDQASPLLRAAARIEARFHLRLAYLDAWAEDRIARWRDLDLDTLRDWLRVAGKRVETGADPAFQLSLVEGEWLRAQQDRDEAHRFAREAWARLRLLTEVPVAPMPLEEPGAPVLPPPQGLAERFTGSVLPRALGARRSLEQDTLRVQEAIAQSRWSLRGTTSREGEEHVTRLGLAYRLPRPGETASLRQVRETQIRVMEQDLASQSMNLEARLRAALDRLEAARQTDLPQPVGLDRALKAVELRLVEGKERPSEALPIRRQLLEAHIAQVKRLRSLHALVAELEALTTGDLS